MRSIGSQIRFRRSISPINRVGVREVLVDRYGLACGGDFCSQLDDRSWGTRSSGLASIGGRLLSWDASDATRLSLIGEGAATAYLRVLAITAHGGQGFCTRSEDSVVTGEGLLSGLATAGDGQRF